MNKNAKNELLEIVNRNHLIIDEINAYSYDIPNNNKYRHDYKSLDDLDFTYSINDEQQRLSGYVRCHDMYGRQVLLVRYKNRDYLIPIECWITNFSH